MQDSLSEIHQGSGFLNGDFCVFMNCYGEMSLTSNSQRSLEVACCVEVCYQIRFIIGTRAFLGPMLQAFESFREFHVP